MSSGTSSRVVPDSDGMSTIVDTEAVAATITPTTSPPSTPSRNEIGNAGADIEIAASSPSLSGATKATEKESTPKRKSKLFQSWQNWDGANPNPTKSPTSPTAPPSRTSLPPLAEKSPSSRGSKKLFSMWEEKSSDTTTIVVDGEMISAPTVEVKKYARAGSKDTTSTMATSATFATMTTGATSMGSMGTDGSSGSSGGSDVGSGIEGSIGIEGSPLSSPQSSDYMEAMPPFLPITPESPSTANRMNPMTPPRSGVFGGENYEGLTMTERGMEMDSIDRLVELTTPTKPEGSPSLGLPGSPSVPYVDYGTGEDDVSDEEVAQATGYSNVMGIETISTKQGIIGNNFDGTEVYALSSVPMNPSDPHMNQDLNTPNMAMQHMHDGHEEMKMEITTPPHHHEHEHGHHHDIHMEGTFPNGDVMDAYRSTVEIMVKQVMPSEVDNIDGLIEEYHGREQELLDTLSAMLANEDLVETLEAMLQDNGENSKKIGENTGNNAGHVEGSGEQVASNVGNHEDEIMTSNIGVSAGADIYNDPLKEIENSPNSQDPNISMCSSGDLTEVTTNMSYSQSKVSPLRNDEIVGKINTGNTTPGQESSKLAYARASTPGSVPSSESLTDDEGARPKTSSSGHQSTQSKQPRQPWCRQKRTWVILFALVVCLAATATALVLAFASPNGGSNTTTSSTTATEGGDDNNKDSVGEKDDNNGVNTQSDKDASDIFGGSVVNESNPPMSSCNAIQVLGLDALDATYPKVAMDGNYAVVSTGPKFLVFYELTSDGETKSWTRQNVFGVNDNLGEASALAISGNVAVIGFPSAFTEDELEKFQPKRTGVIHIYEIDSESGGWKMVQGSLMPNDYLETEELEEEGGESNKKKSPFHNARFGRSLDVDGDLIVVGAPEEDKSSGSVTVFRRTQIIGTQVSSWIEVGRILPVNLCKDPFFGFNVALSRNTIAISSDCSVNIQLHEYFVSEGKIELFQELQYISHEFGAISYIGMNADSLVYSTVYGGVFAFHREGGEGYFKMHDQLSFTDYKESLFEYPLVLDVERFAIGVANEIYVHSRTTGEDGKVEWVREEFVFNAEGEYEGYVGSSIALSGDNLFVGSSDDTFTYDLTSCLSSLPETPESISTTATTTTTTVAPESSSVESAVDLPSLTETSSASEPTSTPSEPPSRITPFPTSALPTTRPTKSPTNSPTAAATVQPIDPNCPYWVDISVNLDTYPSDTRWEIEDESGTVIAQSPPYDNASGRETQIQRECLQAGTFEFIIYDEYGDGICCDWGNGDYSVSASTGEIVAEGGEFGYDERTSFSFQSALDNVSPTPPTLSQPVTESTSPQPPQPTISPSASCKSLDITVNLDTYPQDTRWEIVDDSSGWIMYESPAFNNPRSTDVQTVCLMSGAYSFIIYDTFNDGICCKWGDGSYSLSSEGSVIAEGGEFGSSETTGIVVSNGGITTSSPDSAALTEARTSTTTVFSTLPPLTSCTFVEISLTFDEHPEDTRWEILESEDSVLVASSPSYEGMGPGTTDTQRVCLMSGADYLFTIFDGFGDGMCCNWGDQGHYSVATSDGTIIAEGGAFYWDETTAFSLP